MEPWYMPVPEAAKTAGVSERALRDWLNSQDPPPRLMVGNKQLVSMDGLRKYLKAKEV
ncbi:MAG: hypothetical protein IKG18_08825 [Atopobiaceae bacterium]|nr:hypothetical protein [Eggerthellaceae bacterium]MBR3314227.1 hypothetical protein [Atopobiaceae bacterium]MBR4614293.1 hypothetical protein [Kiritimatiellia bacterium]